MKYRSTICAAAFVSVFCCFSMATAAPAKGATSATALVQPDIASEAYRKDVAARADQGDAEAQYSLGVMYDNGQGVAQDYAAAVSWYRKAADQGEADAQYNLGVMYDNGQGVPQDYVQAHKWFNLSAAGATEAGVRDAAAKCRDIVAAKMTAAQIAEAQRLASMWRKK